MNIKIEAKLGPDSAAETVTVYDTSSSSSLKMCHSIRMHTEMNAAGSCSFTMLPDCPAYGDLWVLGCSVRITVDNAVRFIGRVVHLSYDFVGQEYVECEGALAWLGDIICRPYIWTDEAEITVDGETITRDVQTNVSGPDMLNYIGGQYAARCSSARMVYISTIPPADLIFSSSNNLLFEGVKDYRSVLEMVQEVAAADSNAMYYCRPANQWDAALDFYSLNPASTTATRTMEGGGDYTAGDHNGLITDRQADSDGAGIFTTVIGLGKGKEILQVTTQGGVIDYVDNGAQTYYGVIERVQDFADDNQFDLYNSAYAYAQKGAGNTNGFELKGVDPLYMGGSMIETGDIVKVKDTAHGDNINCLVISCDMELDRPGECSYTFYPLGAAYKRNVTPALSRFVSDSDLTGTATKFLDEQVPTQYNQLSEYAVEANYTNGRRDTYVLTETETEGEYDYVHYVGVNNDE